MEKDSSTNESPPKLKAAKKSVKPAAHSRTSPRKKIQKRTPVKPKSNSIIRPQRKRTTSVSHIVLERKRRNSLRTKIVAKTDKKSETKVTRKATTIRKGKKKTSKAVKKEIMTKKYLGRKCKRKYETSNNKETCEPKPKRIKTNTQSSLLRTIKEKSNELLDNTSKANNSDKKKSNEKSSPQTENPNVQCIVDTNKRKSNDKSSPQMKNLSALGIDVNTILEKVDPSKTSPNASRVAETPQKAETLLDKEFSEDSSDDEEYKPNEDELNELDDTLESKSVTEEVDFDVPGTSVEETGQAGDAVHYMTRSKISYTDQALEDIEQAFIPPDIDLDMYDCVIDDQDWKEFLTEFTRPIDKINTHEDDDTEFIPNIHEEEELIDSEELRRDPGVKVSKKELNELMGELFEFNEIYDFGGNDTIEENINDYVNLKFNETIHDVSNLSTVKTRNTPKKVSFADIGNSNGESSNQKQNKKNGGDGKETPSKVKRKTTPDKSKNNKNASSNLSDEINKQIMDEINKEINKYIEINETYVYKDADTSVNYDNYEEYIVIIGNEEPSAEEINKLAQLKMCENEKVKDSAEKSHEKSGDIADPENTDIQQENADASREPDQQALSIKLVQKTVLSTVQNKPKPKSPPKPPKEKKPSTDSRLKYRNISKRDYNDIQEAYKAALEMYKTKYGIRNDDDLSYRSNIINYAAPLYRKEYEQSGIVPFLVDQTIINDNSASKENNSEPTHETTCERDESHCKEPTNVSPLRQSSIKVNMDTNIRDITSETIDTHKDSTSVDEKPTFSCDTEHIKTESSTECKIDESNCKEPTNVSPLRLSSVRDNTDTNIRDDTTFKTIDTQKDSTSVDERPTVPCDTERIKTESSTECELDESSCKEPTNVSPPRQAQVSQPLFDPEDLKLLQQQINQHIQFSLQHYLQTYNHPRLSNLSCQAKDMIETFYKLSQRKGRHSYFHSLNIDSAMLLVDSWEDMVKNEAFRTHMKTEWNRCIPLWRHYTDTLALPQLIITTILNNEAFIYPVLLPAKSFEPKPRANHLNAFETNCELNLLVMGLLNYASIMKRRTKFDGVLLFHDVLAAVQKTYLPGHSVKEIARKIRDLRESPQENIVRKFFRLGEVEELQHFIIDYTPENVAAPRHQYRQLLPATWQDRAEEFK